MEQSLLPAAVAPRPNGKDDGMDFLASIEMDQQELISKKRNKLKPETAGKLHFVSTNFPDFREELGVDSMLELLRKLAI